MDATQLKEHQTKQLAKAAEFDKKQKQQGYAITDVTPKGFGPETTTENLEK